MNPPSSPPSNASRRSGRRRFLLAMGGLAAALAAGVAVKFFGSGLVQQTKRALADRLYALPESTGVAPLDPVVLDTIVAAVVALLEAPVERTHYADFYSWRAEHLSGHRELYQRAARRLDQACIKSIGLAFLDCKPATHEPVAREVLLLQPETSANQKLWYAMGSRDRFLFDRYIARAAFDLFEHTDLHMLLGYGSWPGMPTGVDAYVQYLDEKVRTDMSRSPDGGA